MREQVGRVFVDCERATQILSRRSTAFQRDDAYTGAGCRLDVVRRIT